MFWCLDRPFGLLQKSKPPAFKSRIFESCLLQTLHYVFGVNGVTLWVHICPVRSLTPRPALKMQRGEGSVLSSPEFVSIRLSFDKATIDCRSFVLFQMNHGCQLLFVYYYETPEPDIVAAILRFRSAFHCFTYQCTSKYKRHILHKSLFNISH